AVVVMIMLLILCSSSSNIIFFLIAHQKSCILNRALITVAYVVWHYCIIHFLDAFEQVTKKQL
ncbi:MAG: hypothetical protein WAM42_19585, partial [Candidatus Nitrosopolaris sp.]